MKVWTVLACTVSVEVFKNYLLPWSFSVLSDVRKEGAVHSLSHKQLTASLGFSLAACKLSLLLISECAL